MSDESATPVSAAGAAGERGSPAEALRAPRGRGEQPPRSRLGEKVRVGSPGTFRVPAAPGDSRVDASRPVTAVDLSQGCLLGCHPVGTSKGQLGNGTELQSGGPRRQRPSLRHPPR